MARAAQFDELRKQLSSWIGGVLSANPDLKTAAVDVSSQVIYDMLVEPPQKEMGDLALGMFAFAKALKTGPPVIAGKLAKDFSSSELFSVQAAGPYLNFKFLKSGVCPMGFESNFR